VSVALLMFCGSVKVLVLLRTNCWQPVNLANSPQGFDYERVQKWRIRNVSLPPFVVRFSVLIYLFVSLSIS